jgi:transcriptional regulator with XRE-family HTH domain
MGELARRAGITYQTISRIEKGSPAYYHTIAAIANAFSKALGEEITVADLKGVTILY